MLDLMCRKRLKDLRKEKKLSCRELSKKFDLEESSISEIERGKRNLTLSNLIKYCKFFKVSSDYILGFKNEVF